MATIKATNFASTTLQTGISASDLLANVAAGTGALFPALGAGEYSYGVFEDTTGNVEIVKITARTVDALTIVRAQEGTTARIWAGGTVFELRPTVQTVVDLAQQQALVEVQTHAATGKTTPIDADELPLVDTADSNALKKLTWANLKTTLAYQPYDADTAKLDVDQTWTGAQRGTVTDNTTSLSFDMADSNNFKCSVSTTSAITFTHITAGQSGFILFVQTGTAAPSAAATTKVESTTLAKLGSAGTYLLSYFSPDGTNVYLMASGILA